MKRWTSGLDAEQGAAIHGLILPNSWYPVRLWNDLVDRYIAQFGGGDPQSFRQVAEQVAETDLNTFFKVLLKMGSPALVLRRASSLWERYFDVGVMEPVERGPRHFLLRLTAPRSVERGPGPVTCAVGVPAWQERALRSAGALGVRSTHVACRFKGATTCEFDVIWP
ncbi:Hypothetical protein CAP_2150 [Chondromyces apiculatus DSM 436]|uniref:4-vinyl reductase 4VR domain-containing protein n=2 Tax=Chondromyces apiculatus TaxID=51 RepID=A0A017TBG8_9BACT|nr:Hypothetical protein CAP_2150 [Chondromyces apiculatus DSM 436]